MGDCLLLFGVQARDPESTRRLLDVGRSLEGTRQQLGFFLLLRLPTSGTTTAGTVETISMLLTAVQTKPTARNSSTR